VDVTTHLRTRTIQVGALLALAGGMIAVASAPALADAPTVQIKNVSATDLPSGGKATMTYTVTNKNAIPGQVRIQVNGNGMNCGGDCSPGGTLGANENRTFSVQLTAPQVGDGQTKDVTVSVTATINNTETGSANQQFTVRGADKPKTVRQVTGRVKDQDGKAVTGANVGVRDSQGHNYTTTTNNDGRYAFTSSDSAPILAGTLTVGAVKQGFSQATVSVQGTAGKTLNVPLTLQGTAASPSATPSASITASAPPTDEATDPATDAATGAATGPTDAASTKDSGSNSTLYIILGGLLVAAGVGAIVLVLMRRKSGGDDGDDSDDNAPSGGPVPPSRGAYHDATRVGAPVGGGRNDATMIAQGGPSISDAPTMMQQAVPLDDEFPDPYGAPVPQPGYGAGGATAGGYGAANQYGTGTYGGAAVPAQSGGYEAGPATQFGQPPADEDPYAAFGAAAGAGNGYGAGGAQQRFDEPTGMYRPEPGGYGQDDGYGAGGGYQGGGQPAPGGYGREPEPEYPAPRGERTGGYQAGAYGGSGGAPYGGQEPAADQGGYGSWGAAAGDIDSGNGYVPPARGGDYGASGGTYGGAGGAAGGGAYGGGQGSGYGAPAGGGGYGADEDGYDQRGGGYGGGRSESYDRGGNGYGGAPAGGYGGGADTSGYGGGNGYGVGDQGGYPEQGGYGGGQGRGYGADQGGGYDDAAGGGYYGADDQRGGGRHGGQPQPTQPESTRQGQRRSLDWLDD
jgi:hypothetical protein